MNPDLPIMEWICILHVFRETNARHAGLDHAVSKRGPVPLGSGMADSHQPEVACANSQSLAVATQARHTPEDEDYETAEDYDSDSSNSEYISFNGCDNEVTAPESKAEREARAYERQLVLEAAGLIVKQGGDPPPNLVRTRSIRRRPPPAPSRRRSTVRSMSKVLPSISQTEAEYEDENSEMKNIDHAKQLDDAFARYESFKNKNANRLSVASTLSVDTLPIPSPISTTPSASGHTRPPSEFSESSIKSYSNYFMHLLGRTKTPEVGDSGITRRSVAVGNISSPIMNSSLSGAATLVGSSSGTGDDALSGGFGTSWASLVDPTALEGIPSGERRRQEAIFELINTEGAYVRDLQLIVEIFYSSMLPLLSTKEVTDIFANVEDILLTNTTFLSVLEERQKDCRLYMDKIGDILVNHIPNMAVYMEYCVNQATAIKVLKSLREENSQLEKHLQKLRDNPAVRNLDVSSYLLVPMQRITRYPLLIKQILNYTEVDDERLDIESAVDLAERLLDEINEEIRDQEGRDKLKILSEHLWIGQGRLDLTAPTRHMGNRKLLREGPLLKAKSGRRLFAFLCTDIFVLTDDSVKSLYRIPIPLSHARIIRKDDLTFQIFQGYPRRQGGDTIVLKALTPRDCQSWTQDIDYAARRCRQAEEHMTKKAAIRCKTR